VNSVSDPAPNETPELQAFRQLEKLVKSLGEELASYRRRASQAEGRLRMYESATKSGDLFAEQRAALLERENSDLRARLTFATERARGVLEQVRFLRQQAARPVVTTANDR
jgi:hypothetical protein